MAGRSWDSILDHIRTLSVRSEAAACDAELLRQFVCHHEEAAFEALLRRHGPIVLRVARRVLGSQTDAEDVFQATFLLLVRRAGSIRKRESVASWLHGVAHRLALAARRNRSRRQQREREAAEARSIEAPPSAWNELEEALHEVLAQLPAKYRTPLLYCYLEGWTQEEVARQLGKPLGTVRSWLARGRELLRKRLLRRGISLSVEGTGAALLASACAPAEAVSPALRMTTLHAAHLFATGGNAMTPTVAALVRKGLTAMLLAKLMSGAVCLLIVAVFVAGAGWAAHRTFDAKAPEQEKKAENAPPQQVAAEKRPRTDANGDSLPPRAIARLGTNRFRHEGMLGSFVLSPDGKKIAATPHMFGKSAAIWDISTGRLVKCLTFDHEVHFLAFPPDGRSLAVGSAWEGQSRNGILRILDLASGKETRRFVGHLGVRNNVNNVSIWEAAFFTPDGKTLVTLGGDGTVFRWDVPSGKKLGELNGSSWITWGLSPDGKLLAARQQGSEKLLRLFDVATGKEVRQLRHPAEVFSAAFSPDGKTVATSFSTMGQRGWDSGKIALWQVESGKELGTLIGHEGPVPALAFSPDGKMLASGGIDSRLCLWDVAAQKELHKALVLPTSVMQLAFSHDGKTLISRGKENHVRLWDVAAWRERVVAEGPGQPIVAVAYSPDGKRVASVSGNTGIWLWETATGKLLHTFEFGIAPVRFSADGKSLTAGLANSSHIYVWNTESGEVRQRIPIAGNLYRYVAMSPDGKTLAATDRGDVYLWRAGPEERLHRLKVPFFPEAAAVRGKRRHPMPPQVFGLCFSADGKTLYACGSQTHVLRWEVATDQLLPPIGIEKDGANGIALSPDERSVATVTPDRKLYLWEIASRQPRLIVKDGEHTRPIAFSPDGRWLASTKGDTVQLLRATDGKIVHRFTGHRGLIFSLSFSPDGRTLASGGYDSTVLVWDIASIAATDKGK